jgi:putative DNA primase/helicase
MTAAEIAAILGDARREGRAWRCRCPLHGGRSLVIRDGDGDRVLVTCWGGCDRPNVLAELQRRGMLSGGGDYSPHVISVPRRDARARRTSRSLNIWRQTERDVAIVGRYLAGRGIVLDPWPASLRFHPRCPRPKDDAGSFVPPLPAMVGLVEHVKLGPVGVHCTYLQRDGSSKADIEKAKAIFGAVDGGAIRIGAPRAGQWFAVAEGIETTLSVGMACSMPAWAALSAAGIKKLVLPPQATHVLICADHDASGTGERAARDAAARWLAEGRRVRIAIPPVPGTDFNDILTERAPHTDEVRRV